MLRQENGSGKIYFTEFKSKLGKKYSSPEQTLPQNPKLKSSFSQKKSVQFFSSFLLFLLICFPLFPFCPGPPHHWVMTLTMICCHPAELSELVPGVNIKARRISSQCTAQDATCFRFAGLGIFIVLRCFKERSLRLDRRTLEAELLNDFDDFHQFPTLL